MTCGAINNTHDEKLQNFCFSIKSFKHNYSIKELEFSRKELTLKSSLINQSETRNCKNCYANFLLNMRRTQLPEHEKKLIEVRKKYLEVNL